MLSEMNPTTNESNSSRMLPKDQIGSPSFDEGSYGGTLKKGPWTSAEDAILVEYVKKYGEGNWNAVQKNTGLSRCGKSCRLRWANHLKPNLKKGAFTADEEKLIIQLHAEMGNKWARMAAYVQTLAQQLQKACQVYLYKSEAYHHDQISQGLMHYWTLIAFCKTLKSQMSMLC